MKPHYRSALSGLFALLALSVTNAFAANVAMLGTATQSSDLQGFGVPPSASLAIDGDRNGHYFEGHTTITNNTDPSPNDDGLFDFWQVTLDQTYSISNVLLFGRTDCCLDRIDPFRLELFNGATTVFSQDVAAFVEDIKTFNDPAHPANGLLTRGMVFNIPNIEADRLRITLLQQNYLEIAEVEVNGVVPQPVPIPATGWLLASALAGLAARSRRKRRS